MKLTKFKVTNFRSVIDSGWIDCEDVTTLVGVNEAGKSNLLLALWKLNPVQYGEIDILHDMPTSRLSELRDKTSETVFISAVFSADKEDVEQIESRHQCEIKGLNTFTVSRRYDGSYTVGADGARCLVEEEDEEGVVVKKEMDAGRFRHVLRESIPHFVYYSNYGNLSSKIYLPHATKWLKGESVPGVDPNEDQVRTLRVLFDFVKLNPDEIRELGESPEAIARNRGRGQTEEEDVQKASDEKEKRTILLNSASTNLTNQFREWWRQGEYVFHLRADGDYFKIWVSDERRPVEVDLENRSTGLQWFISFFLVFLVEAQQNNADSVLLLDEAGLSLHPKAQEDLIAFFKELSKDNQLLHTTHSPFLIDTNNIDECVAVYVDESGNTVASNDMRAAAGELASNSVYSVHAALGLSVSDVLLAGCAPVIVEGPSDQFALSGIKTYLVSKRKITPKKDIVFLPAGGAGKGIAGIASILGKDDLPPVIYDSDTIGKNFARSIKQGLYKDEQDKVVELGDIISVSNPEIEDLIPFSISERYFNKLFSSTEDLFADFYNPKKPMVPQVEAFADAHHCELPQGEWKVNLAKYFKERLLNKAVVDNKYVEKWTDLFKRIM